MPSYPNEDPDYPDDPYGQGSYEDDQYEQDSGHGEGHRPSHHGTSSHREGRGERGRRPEYNSSESQSYDNSLQPSSSHVSRSARSSNSNAYDRTGHDVYGAYSSSRPYETGHTSSWAGDPSVSRRDRNGYGSGSYDGPSSTLGRYPRTETSYTLGAIDTYRSGTDRASTQTTYDRMSVDDHDRSYDDRRSVYGERGSTARQGDTDQYLGGIGSHLQSEDISVRRSDTLSVSSASSTPSASHLLEGRYNSSRRSDDGYPESSLNYRTGNDGGYSQHPQVGSSSSANARSYSTTDQAYRSDRDAIHSSSADASAYNYRFDSLSSGMQDLSVDPRQSAAPYPSRESTRERSREQSYHGGGSSTSTVVAGSGGSRPSGSSSRHSSHPSSSSSSRHSSSRSTPHSSSRHRSSRTATSTRERPRGLEQQPIEEVEYEESGWPSSGRQYEHDDSGYAESRYYR